MSRTHSSRREDSNELVAVPGGRLPDEEAQIRGDHGMSIQATGQQQHDSGEQDRRNEVSPEEVTRLWADLEAETGYATYLDYLKACQNRNPSKVLRESLDLIEGYYSYGPDPTCSIFDLSKGDNSRPELTLYCSTSSGSDVLAALRQPQAGTAIRIILWYTARTNESVFDALGLGLKIHPRFFQVLLTSREGEGFNSEKWNPDTIDTLPLMPDIVVIDRHVVTMARDYLSGFPDATPVILIAVKHVDALSSETQIDEMSRFRSATLKGLSDPLDKLPTWIKEYVRILQYDLEKGRRSTGSDIHLSFRPLVPLLYSNTFRIREECALVRKKYYNFITFIAPRARFERKTDLEDLYEMRIMLRRIIEDSEDNSEQLQRFLRSQQILEVRQEKSSTTIEDDLKQACLEAHRLEAEIRDQLQLQTGEMALQESRKSIELSNLQIEEGKRVKIFTILAFVYVPLNLATSIFGMNIQQLNGSGQHLRVFIITAVTTLAVTGCSWLVIEQGNSYLKWRKRSPDETYDGNTQFTLVVRLALLVYLVSSGKTYWMFKRGIWWRILTNHSSRFWSPCCPREDNGRLNAGEYVSKYGKGPWIAGSYDPFVEWNSAR